MQQEVSALAGAETGKRLYGAAEDLQEAPPLPARPVLQPSILN